MLRHVACRLTRVIGNDDYLVQSTWLANITGKTVVITGAADGLGRAMAESFIKKKVKVVIILDLDEKKGEETVSSFKTQYGEKKAVFIKCNVTTDLDQVLNKIIKDYKEIDILINNAGVLSESNIRHTIEVNVVALMEWTIKFYDFMSVANGRKGGTIMNVSSTQGYRIGPYIPYYHASKSAVLGFSKSLGHQTNFEKTGVRVVTLCPGLTRSNMAHKPRLRDSTMEPSFIKEITDYDWQQPESIGNGTVEIFENADSGSVWLVEGARPAEKLNI